MDQEFVKITAIKVIFDLFLMYGLTTFEQNPEDENPDETGASGENTTVCSNSDTPKPQTADDGKNQDATLTADQDLEESEKEGDTSAAESVLSVLLMFLQDESADLRSVVAEGMAKVCSYIL